MKVGVITQRYHYVLTKYKGNGSKIRRSVWTQQSELSAHVKKLLIFDNRRTLRPSITSETFMQRRRFFGRGRVGFVALFSDATHRKALEAQQRYHTGQLEAANRDWKSFSYFVAHDLRANQTH